MSLNMFDIRQLAEMVAEEAAKDQGAAQAARKQVQQDLVEGLVEALHDLQSLDRQAEATYELANGRDAFLEATHAYEKAQAVARQAISQLQPAHERVLAAEARRQYVLRQHEEAMKDLRREVEFNLDLLGVTEEGFRAEAFNKALELMKAKLASQVNMALALVEAAQKAEAKCRKWVSWKVWAFQKARWEYRQEARPTVVGFGVDAPKSFLGDKLQAVVN